MPKTREQYMQLAEDALYVRRDDACAAVYVDLAQMAEPAETVTTHTGDGREVRTDTIATVTVGGVTLGGPDARIATGNGDPDADAIAYAILGVPEGELAGHVPPWVHDATDRVVALLCLLGRDA